AAVVEDARRTLLREPLAKPALVETGLRGQLGARPGLAVGERSVEPQPVAEPDHDRGHGAAEGVAHPPGVLLEGLGIERATHSRSEARVWPGVPEARAAHPRASTIGDCAAAKSVDNRGSRRNHHRKHAGGRDTWALRPRAKRETTRST